jgi:hypothetical protein
MIRRIGVVAFVIVLMWPPAAMAITGQGQQTVRNWAASNRCAQAAQRAFPDFTPESNAKRDAQLKQCLAGGNLPPRPSLETAPKP